MICNRCLLCMLLLIVGCQRQPASPPKPSGLAYVYDGVHFATAEEEFVQSVRLVGDGIQLKDVQLVLPDGFAVEPEKITAELLKEHGAKSDVSGNDGQGNFNLISDAYGSFLNGDFKNHRLVRLSLTDHKGVRRTEGFFKIRLRGQDLEYPTYIKDLRMLFGEPDAIVPAHVYRPVH